MKKFKYIGFLLGLILLVVGVRTENISVRKVNLDPSLNAFPISLSESMANAISPSGQGIFIVSDCNSITNPVSNGTYCFNNSSIYVYQSGTYQPISGGGGGSG